MSKVTEQVISYAPLIKYEPIRTVNSEISLLLEILYENKYNPTENIADSKNLPDQRNSCGSKLNKMEAILVRITSGQREKSDKYPSSITLRAG
ncbi:MAG: hypothetical protein QXV01_03955 [Candidatus Bathyarchaeia archaeon]